MSKLFVIVAEKTEKSDTFSELLNKHKQWHVLQVGARIVRFLHNMTTPFWVIFSLDLRVKNSIESAKLMALMLRENLVSIC